jgi:hypothetical protein
MDFFFWLPEAGIPGYKYFKVNITTEINNRLDGII